MNLTPISAALLAAALLLPLSPAVAEQAPQSQQLPQSKLPQQVAPKSYPKIVLYSTSWCPHCKAAKEYFTDNNIPFINRDVELDNEAMDLLTNKYKSEAVPVLVIGDDLEVVRGFNPESFSKILEKYRKK